MAEENSPDEADLEELEEQLLDLADEFLSQSSVDWFLAAFGDLSFKAAMLRAPGQKGGRRKHEKKRAFSLLLTFCHQHSCPLPYPTRITKIRQEPVDFTNQLRSFVHQHEPRRRPRWVIFTC